MERKYEASVLLGRGEPGHGGQWEQPDVPARDDERVGDALEAPDLHREVIETLGLALFLRPRRAAAPRDEMPKLEVIARQIVGALGELEVVAAVRETTHRDLERAEPPKGGEEVSAQAADLLARWIRARAAVAPATGLRVDRELAVALVEPLPKALAPHRGGRPDDRCTRGHVVADYPAGRMGDKTFFSHSWCEKMNESGL